MLVAKVQNFNYEDKKDNPKTKKEQDLPAQLSFKLCNRNTAFSMCHRLKKSHQKVFNMYTYDYS